MNSMKHQFEQNLLRATWSGSSGGWLCCTVQETCVNTTQCLHCGAGRRINSKKNKVMLSKKGK